MDITLLNVYKDNYIYLAMNKDLNNVVVDIIGVASIWQLSHMFYNLTRIEDRRAYWYYVGFSSVAYFFTIKTMYKYC